MADLHARLLAEIERRERIAWAARGPLVGMTEEARAYWSVHRSDDALRRYAHYRRILERHPDRGDRHHWCYSPFPGEERPQLWTPLAHECPALRDLADALGVPWKPAQPDPGTST